MPASDARTRANRENAKRSTGPTTVAGKEQSRRNSLKHGLTGAGVVLPEADAAEVRRKSAAYVAELQPSGEVGRDLACRAAMLAVRMERAVDQQAASLAEHVRQAEAEFVAPEGVSAETADRLRCEAARRAMFDPSKEATLARSYEQAAERGYYRALKELRQVERAAIAEAPASDASLDREMMGSFSGWLGTDAASEALAGLNIPNPSWPARTAPIPASKGGIDLPITVGRPR